MKKFFVLGASALLFASLALDEAAAQRGGRGGGAWRWAVVAVAFAAGGMGMGGGGFRGAAIGGGGGFRGGGIGMGGGRISRRGDWWQRLSRRIRRQWLPQRGDWRRLPWWWVPRGRDRPRFP